MFKKLITIIAVTASLVGCGSQLAYNNVSLISNWYLSDYVTLNSDQKTLFKEHLATLHSWHRQQELPEYHQGLVKLKEHLNQDVLDSDYLNAQVSDLRVRWLILLKEASPYLTELAATLSDQQIDELFSALDKKNQDRLDNVDSSKEHRKNNLKRIEKWMGPLTKDQRQAVEMMADQHPDLDPITVAAHRAFQSNVKAMLQRRDETGFTERFSRLLQQPLSTPQGEILNEAREKRLDAQMKLYRSLWASASDSQRQKVRAKIQGYIDDIDDLMQK